MNNSPSSESMFTVEVAWGIRSGCWGLRCGRTSSQEEDELIGWKILRCPRGAPSRCMSVSPSRSVLVLEHRGICRGERAQQPGGVSCVSGILCVCVCVAVGFFF